MKHVCKYLLLPALVLCLCALWGCGEKVPSDQPDDSQTQQQGTPNGGETQQAAPSDMIECSDGNTTLRFIRADDGSWAWKDDLDFPLNNTYTDHLLRSVEEMLTAQPITTDKTAEDLELDEETKYVTVTNEKGEKVTWYLGSKDDVGCYYMRRADDTAGNIYLSPADLSAQIGRSIYDMMVLPQLNAIPAQSVRSVLIVRGQQQVDMLPNSQGNLTSDIADVQPLLDMLAQPELSACVDFRPSEGAAAICALDPADTVLTVEYVNTALAERTFTLSIGNKLGDGYCVRINDDTTIYRMDTASVEAILAFVPAE